MNSAIRSVPKIRCNLGSFFALPTAGGEGLSGVGDCPPTDTRSRRMEPGRRSRDRVVSNFLQVTTWVYLGSFASSTTEGVTCSRGVRCGGSHSTSTCAGAG